MDGESAHTCGVYERETLNKSYGVYAGNIKPLPASRILALHKVVEARHVRLRFGKLGAVAFIRIPSQRLLLFAH